MNVPQAAAIVSVNESLKVLYRPEKGHNILTYFLCAGIAGNFPLIFLMLNNKRIICCFDDNSFG